MPTPPPQQPIHILHLEDSAIDHSLVLRSLRQSGLTAQLQRVDNLAAFEQAVQTAEFDLILLLLAALFVDLSPERR